MRALVFVLGICYALAITFFLGYAGSVDVFWCWAQLSLVPLAVVAWVLASCTKWGDLWTAGYISMWAVEGLVVWIGSTLVW